MGLEPVWVECEVIGWDWKVNLGLGLVVDNGLVT